MILIIGAPRSGTSWLAKIFDSHPDVLYRHEPDTIIRCNDFPAFCDSDDFDRYSVIAQDYLHAIMRIRTSKVVGSIPVFSKSYQKSIARTIRGGFALSAKIGEQLIFIGKYFRRITIPDLINPKASPPQLVMKSIAALGRAGLYLHATPGIKAILIIRHPCGHIASVLKGLDMGKFDSSVPITEDFGVYSDLSKTREAQKYDITLERIKAMTPIERLAWRWAISNEKAMNDLEKSDNTLTIRYEDLCEDPEKHARALFEFSGLNWNSQTENFVQASVSHQGAERFYQVFRDPKKSASKWKTQLTSEHIDCITTSIGHTRPGKLFF